MASAHKVSPLFMLLSTQQLVLLQQQVLLLILLFCLAFMMPFISSSSNSSGHVVAGCMKAERDALLAFKAEIIYHKDHPISSWGDLTDDCCQWPRVRCDNNSGHVIQLHLNHWQPSAHHYYNTYYDYYTSNYYYYAHFYGDVCDDEGGLSGNISPILAGLKHLRYLDLSCNFFFNVTIPKFLGSLANLVHLDLSFSHFTGVIPHELGNLTRLRRLILVDWPPQTVQVDDAEWLSGLSSLRYLFMDGVDLSGVTNIMQSLNKLHHLKEVSLFDCGVKSIPESLPYLNFTSLIFIEMGWNMFDNTSIPEWLFRMHNIRYLSMDSCGWTGTIPSSVGNATSLQYLDLSDNSGISGDMPRGFSDLCNLQLLFLDETFVGRSLEDFRDAFSAGCIRRSLIQFSFSSSSLKGPLPDWLGEFRNLTYLDLSGNSLQSSIPESLGRLSRLQYLFLGDNALNGSIPESLGRLSRLQYLFLEDNALNGSIPESLGRLSRLQFLYLRNNALNGSIPESLGRLSRLQSLYLQNNTFHGSIPESLGQLSNLVVLAFGDNNFKYSSVITEAHLANLTSLRTLWLGNSNLVLNISTDWTPGFQATAIQLSYCQVGPKFPVWLANQVNLKRLDISNTGIKDSMPDWFWNITTRSMIFLNLSNNEITGKLPQRLKFQQKKEYYVGIFLSSNLFKGFIPTFPPNVGALDLSNNSFSGPIPSDLGNFGGLRSGLNTLSFSSNNLTGSIPSSLCNFTELELLDLSNNHLEGVIPNCWNNLTNLQYLILANNSLKSRAPDSLISSSQSLQVLHFSNNRLHGEFPSFLKNCTSLITLALDHNNLSGNIPTWVGETMTSLMIITLKRNNFSGNLPLLSNLTSLHFLDFSHNSFTGSIPQSYGNLKGMVNNSMNGGARFTDNVSAVLIVKITVATKGVELQYGIILSSLKFIDLSMNNLSGQIPKEIVKLVGLQSLDLSCNYLTGEIPRDIGAMQSLESLDLSRNELIGSIPTGLSTLHFLESLNLSHNNLSGRIPYASQLTTFNDPSIYDGNLNLCGAPLVKNCTSTDEPTADSQVDDQEDDDDDNPLWFFIGLMPGFVVGFWTVCSILLFKKKWRHAYFKFVDYKYDMIYVKVVVTTSKLKRALIS